MFYKDKSKKDGLQTYCKDCAKEGNARRYFENKEERKKKDAKYYAENKERISKQKSEYRRKNIEKVKEQHSQWYIDNKEKILEYQKQRYQENKEEIKSKVAQYNREHKEEISERRAVYRKSERSKAINKAAHHKRRIAKLENGGSFSADEWINVCVEFGGICAYCGKEAKLTADHIVPVSKGGASNINNIVPVCQSCNSSKHNYDLDAWYPQQPFFMPERYNKVLQHSK